VGEPEACLSCCPNSNRNRRTLGRGTRREVWSKLTKCAVAEGGRGSFINSKSSRGCKQ